MDWQGPLVVDPTMLSPKLFMLAVLQDPNAPFEARMDAAKAVAPYVHARLSSIDVAVTQRRSIADYSDEELRAIANAGANGLLELETTAQEIEDVAEPSLL